MTTISSSAPGDDECEFVIHEVAQPAASESFCLVLRERIPPRPACHSFIADCEMMYTCSRVPGLSPHTGSPCNSGSSSSSSSSTVLHLQHASSYNGSYERRRTVSVRSSREEATPPKFDVSSNCVTPVFRVSPFVQKTSDLENPKVRVLFVSEGNVCRSVYAEAIFNSLIDEHEMHDFVECASKASRDYNIGESPDARAVAVADEIGLKLPEGATARVFECQSDIVLFDLLVVMDKFNASDVLKEVTVYEAIDKEARYTHKVRRLAEFCRTKKMEDIDDPLYGNMGGPEELALLREVYQDIRASCIGLMQTIVDVKAGLQGSETLKQGVGKSLGEMESLDWLVPPMLQKAETQRR